MKKRIVFTSILLIALLFDISAQKAGRKSTISGRVTDGFYSPVTGALILVDGKSSSVKTDNDGHYRIRVKPSASLIGVFTTISGAVEKPIDGRTEIDFNFGEDFFLKPVEPGGSQGVFNDGYGFARGDDKTKPVSRTDVSGNKYASFGTIYDILKTLPGVSVTGESVLIRGVSTISSASPLFVVNSVTVNSITGIDPAMVKSIDILKGAAASIYGVEGGNGVIVINTKTGR